MGLKLIKNNIKFFKGEIFYSGKKWLNCDFIKDRENMIGSDMEPKLLPIEGPLPDNLPEFFVYKDSFYMIDKPDTYTDDEKKLMIKEHFYKHNEKFKKLLKDIQ